MQAIDWLASRSLYHPDKVALAEVASGRRFTYREMNDEANRIANWLESAGVKAGERVALLAGNSAEALFTFLGSNKAGAISLPLNFRLAPPELHAILLEAEPALLVYSEEQQPTVEALRAMGSLPRAVKLAGTPAAGDLSLAAEIARHTERREAGIRVSFDAPCMILYTSGTAGKPKGAVLPHGMIFWNSVNFCLRDLLPTDTVLMHTPLFYTGGLNVYTLPALILGGTVVMMKSWNAEEAVRLIEAERVTVFFAVPTQLQMMTETSVFENTDLSSLRYIISGGASCPLPLMEKLMSRGIAYKQGMGLTEVGPNCFALEARDAHRKAGSIGFPNLAVEARIVEENGANVSPGEVGELILRTPAMITGYWKNPEATAAAIRGGWFHTEDLAKRDAEGFFYIVDRKKDMYISGGENVYPAEVEHVLLQHPKVSQVAVVGIPDAKWGEVGCAVIVLRPGDRATEEELLTFCHGRIAKYKIPKSVVVVPELPRTHSGKVQKTSLKKEILDRRTFST